MSVLTPRRESYPTPAIAPAVYAKLRTAKRVNKDRPREPGNGRVPQEVELDQGELQAIRGH